MPKRIILLLVFLGSVPIAVFSQNYYKIEFKVTGLENRKLYLGHYYDDKTYICDTTYANKSGEFTFTRYKQLKNGVYFLVEGKTKLFDFIVGDNKTFRLESSSSEYNEKMTVFNDTENKVWFENIRFIIERNKEAKPYVDVIKDARSSTNQIDEAKAKFNEINLKVQNYHVTIQNNYPNSITAKMFNADWVPAYKDLYNFRRHYFDNFNLADDALLRLPKPYYQQKLNHYLDQLNWPHKDSALLAINNIISVSKRNPETYKYSVYTILRKYATKNDIASKQVLVKVYDTYFKSGEMDYWISSSQFDDVSEVVRKTRLELPSDISERNVNESTDRQVVSKADANRINLVKPVGKYYALLIGVSSYEDGRLNLANPVSDVTKFQTVLTEKYDFDKQDVLVLNNPRREEILKQLYLLRKTITSNDNLLIFYAGHGFWDADIKQGYWWPNDASPDNPHNWISNSDIKEVINGIKSGHTLLIADACFSGSLFRDASQIKSSGLGLQALYRLPSRQAMTSTTLTKVSDDSAFLYYLLKRLQENQEKYLTARDLFSSLQVAVASNSLNAPQFQEIPDTGHEGGEFIFIKK